jgi:hypothetical protein
MEYQQNPYNKTGKYTKLKEGNTRLRLFEHINGWEYWTDEDGKRTPHRVKDLDLIPLKLRPEAKYFFAYVVWNYGESNTQILSITQRSIIEPLSVLYHDADWGKGEGLDKFDVVIARTGEGLETQYGVTPKPHSEFKEKLDSVDLKALFENGDPFKGISNEAMDKIVEDLDNAQKSKY